MALTSRFGLREHRRGKVVTLVPDSVAGHLLDLVKQDFTAARLDKRWCGEITYVRVGVSGFVHFPTVYGPVSRRLPGWSIATHVPAGLVRDAPAAAVAVSSGRVRVMFLFHSVRGSRYTSSTIAECHHVQRIGRTMDGAGYVGQRSRRELLQQLQARGPAVR